MAEHLKLRHPVTERPQSAWGTIAVELLGSQTRFVEGERWTHRIIEKGDGPPLVLFHGAGAHADAYARMIPALAKSFRVIAADLLFCGYSSKEPWEPGNTRMLQAQAYIDLIHALGYQKAHYEGATMGFEIAMHYPETLDKLILHGFGPVDTKRKEFKKQPFKGELLDLSQKAVADPSYENIRNRLLWLVHDDSTITEEMIAIRQRLYQDAVVNASMRRVFGMEGERVKPTQFTEDEVRAKWNTPALVVYGEHNPGRGPDYGEYCADLIGAKFYEFKGAGHWPQWETPDEYAAVITEFLLD